MNIKRDIVARAMIKAGEDPLTDEEFNDKKGTRWRTVKDFYFSVIQEALAGTEWTSQKKRKKLSLSEDENLTAYMFIYDLPEDCAKAIEINNEEEYLIEGRYLYTDVEEVILTYISSGYNPEITYEEANPQPTEDTFSEGTYYTYDTETESYIPAVSWTDEEIYYVVKEDTSDYPGYDDFTPDPMLAEYIETKLAANLALKLTGDNSKYQLLFSEAQIIENRAIKASMAHGHNKDKGNKWWTDTLGNGE